jgi:hypothetical protein
MIVPRSILSVLSSGLIREVKGDQAVCDQRWDYFGAKETISTSN